MSKSFYAFWCRKCGNYWMKSFSEPVIKLFFYDPKPVERCKKCGTLVKGTSSWT